MRGISLIWQDAVRSERRLGHRPSQPPPEEVVVLLRVGLIPHKEDVAKVDLELAVDEHLPNQGRLSAVLSIACKAQVLSVAGLR